MNCERAIRRALEGKADARIVAHQRECATCREALRQHTRVTALLDEWQPEVETSPGFEARLHARIQQAKAGRRFRIQVTEWWGEWLSTPVAAVAAVVLVIVLGVAVMLRHDFDSQTRYAQNATVVTDLQTLARDKELVESFDLISEQGTAGTPAAVPAQTQDQ